LHGDVTPLGAEGAADADLARAFVTVASMML
jgi:hypothetical protein